MSDDPHKLDYRSKDPPSLARLIENVVVAIALAWIAFAIIGIITFSYWRD